MEILPSACHKKVALSSKLALTSCTNAKRNNEQDDSAQAGRLIMKNFKRGEHTHDNRLLQIMLSLQFIFFLLLLFAKPLNNFFLLLFSFRSHVSGGCRWGRILICLCNLRKESHIC